MRIALPGASDPSWGEHTRSGWLREATPGRARWHYPNLSCP